MMKIAIFGFAAALASAATLAAPTSLLPPQAGDLHAATARAATADALPAATAHAAAGAKASADATPTALPPAVAREPVSASWPLHAPAAAPGIAATASDAVQDSAPAPYIAQSRESYQAVTGAQLAKGVTLNTTAPRALVRLQALDGGSPRENDAIHPRALTITNASGQGYTSGAGMEMLVTDAQLAKADMPFAPGTSAFRLHKDLGSGPFRMQASGLAPGQRYLLNIVEPDSPYTLAMQTGAVAYLHGQELTVQAELQDKSGPRRAITRMEGQVVSPAGRSFPLVFKPDASGRMQARLQLDADEAAMPGLWEVRADASARIRSSVVQRTLRLAFAAAMPTARLTGSAQLADSDGGAALRIGVQAAAAGRYEVRGVLYGSVAGVRKPLGVAHAAQWMEAGEGAIALSFAPVLLDGASGPYELRDLQLLDQGRVALLHRQQHALDFSDTDLARVSPRRAASNSAAAPARTKQAPNATPR